MMNKSEINLRRALIANVLFSSTCALIALLFSAAIADWMNIGESKIILALGVGLFLFAGSILLLLRSRPLKAKQVQAIIIQDWFWVIGSFFIIVFRAFGMSTAAYWLLAGIALIVMSLALVQGYFLKKRNIAGVVEL